MAEKGSWGRGSPGAVGRPAGCAQAKLWPREQARRSSFPQPPRCKFLTPILAAETLSCHPAPSPAAENVQFCASVLVCGVGLRTPCAWVPLGLYNYTCPSASPAERVCGAVSLGVNVQTLPYLSPQGGRGLRDPTTRCPELLECLCRPSLVSSLLQRLVFALAAMLLINYIAPW